MAISYEPEVMLARDQRQTILSFAALVQRPLTSVISLGSKHITQISQLRGKTVGTAGIRTRLPFWTRCSTTRGSRRSSVKQVDVGANLVPAMLSGRVDATLGGYWNYEAIELRQAHKKPERDPGLRRGVPAYDELVLVTSEKYFENHVTLLRGLVQALGRGYAAVRANPQQGVNALLAANPSLDPTLQAAASARPCRRSSR